MSTTRGGSVFGINIVTVVFVIAGREGKGTSHDSSFRERGAAMVV